jgi:hypothetical protein
VLSPEKTKITHVEDGFDFLGQNLRKFGGKLLIRPSKKNTEAFLLKVRSILKANKPAAQANVIWQLNPVIRGWVNYHRHVTASKAFERVPDVGIGSVPCAGSRSATGMRSVRATGPSPHVSMVTVRSGNPIGCGCTMPPTPKSAVT